jgi:Xaa-Pro aminopeptidase
MNSTMKNKLELLMKANDIAAIFITGPADHNPAMMYFTGNVHVSRGDLVIKPGEEPVLFHDAFERDEAAKTGCVLQPNNKYPYSELLKETKGDKTKIESRRFAHILEDCGITAGKVVLYGQWDAGKAYSTTKGVAEYLPDVEFTADWDDAILFGAMTTKDENELNQIREMGKITTAVVARTADFLSQQRAKNNELIQQNGDPVTIGQVKRLINLWLAEAGAENPEGTIFSLGRDAGVPHSTGNASETLRLGETIVFDIFPCQVGGGYFYDFTRTWCLGYAPDEVVQLHNQVKQVYDQIVSELRVYNLCRPYQLRTCELFETMGHPTVRTNKNTEDGYNHSIGHGLGLRVHEKPWFGDKADESDNLAPGTVFTVEPGLYYPDRGMGVRIEDTYCANHENKIELMADYPYDLILPVRLRMN